MLDMSQVVDYQGLTPAAPPSRAHNPLTISDLRT